MEYSTADIEEKLKVCEELIESLKEAINENMILLDKESSTIGNLVNLSEILVAPNSYVCVKYVFDDKTYNIIVPPLISIDDFCELIQDKNFTQQVKGFDAKCLQLAQAYGRRMYYRNFDDHGNEKNTDITKLYNIDQFMSGAAAFWNENWVKVDRENNGDAKIHEQAQKEIMEIMYNEVVNGRPSVIQVDTTDAKGDTTRHYAVVVGVSDDADLNNIKQEDFLILDPWDGKVSQLGDHRHIYSDYTTHKDEGAYWYRVLTLVNEEQILENINKARKGMGWRPITSLKMLDDVKKEES